MSVHCLKIARQLGGVTLECDILKLPVATVVDSDGLATDQALQNFGADRRF